MRSPAWERWADMRVKIVGALILAIVVASPYAIEAKKKGKKTRSSQSAQQEENKEEEKKKPTDLEKALGLFGAATKINKASRPMSLADEERLGRSIALEVFKRFGKITRDKKLNRYVSLVGKIVASSRKDKRHYRFAVIENSAANAFAAPGGYIFITTGLIASLKDEAALAGVLAHEVAHVRKKHMVKAIQRMNVLSGVAEMSAVLSGDDPAKYNKIVRAASDILFTKGLDKKDEFDADAAGVGYAAKSGYHPFGLVTFLETLGGKKGSSSIFLSTHPPISQRIKKLKQKTLPKYKKRGQLLAKRFSQNTRR